MICYGRLVEMVRVGLDLRNRAFPSPRPSPVNLGTVEAGDGALLVAGKVTAGWHPAQRDHHYMVVRRCRAAENSANRSETTGQFKSTNHEIPFGSNFCPTEHVSTAD